MLYYQRMNAALYYRTFGSTYEHYQTSVSLLETFKREHLLQTLEDFAVQFESPVFTIHVPNSKRGVVETMNQISKMAKYYDELVGEHLSDVDKEFLYRSSTWSIS